MHELTKKMYANEVGENAKHFTCLKLFIFRCLSVAILTQLILCLFKSNILTSNHFHFIDQFRIRLKPTQHTFFFLSSFWIGYEWGNSWTQEKSSFLIRISMNVLKHCNFLPFPKYLSHSKCQFDLCIFEGIYHKSGNVYRMSWIEIFPTKCVHMLNIIFFLDFTSIFGYWI